ncbi:helix-turn-helix domain-containing protein [Micromonospora sp. KC721]|uniref:helix-turn-helix domain-containing protein n=1 Tax=Micromonospora sp. KC721 TaxID=2530380 RepID=UPI001044DD99|nr:helix-turn-helix transcriptional regulator [Micromonospora sp. KC721]TDB80228.1 XRE family transcriptional regulator [Micromonospora sp. KC721]
MATLDADRSVGQYFAINLRKIRETKGLSQAELAQRIKDLGHPCTQATIWKLEQGHREPKLTEAVAIGAALDLWSWTELTSNPATFNVATAVDQWRRRAFELAEQTRAAAAAQMDALIQLAFAVRAAQDAGLSVEWAEGRAGGWLELTPEVTVLREVLAARAAEQMEDEERDRRRAEEDRLVEQIVGALENSGVPLVIKPEDIRFVGPDPSRDEDADG